MTFHFCCIIKLNLKQSLICLQSMDIYLKNFLLTCLKTSQSSLQIPWTNYPLKNLQVSDFELVRPLVRFYHSRTAYCLIKNPVYSSCNEFEKTVDYDIRYYQSEHDRSNAAKNAVGTCIL